MANPPIVNRDVKTGRVLKEDNTFINIADIIGTATDLTGGIYVVDEIRHAVHSGDAYSYDVDGTIAAESSIYVLGATGDKQIHFDSLLGNFSKGGIRLSLYESPTVTSNGTLQNSVNLNFASSNTSTMAIYSAPTITDNGILKTSLFIPITGVGVNVSPAAGGIANGRVLKQNTLYLLQIQNTDTSACPFGISFNWHDDINIL